MTEINAGAATIMSKSHPAKLRNTRICKISRDSSGRSSSGLTSTQSCARLTAPTSASSLKSSNSDGRLTDTAFYWDSLYTDSGDNNDPANYCDSATDSGSKKARSSSSRSSRRSTAKRRKSARGKPKSSAQNNLPRIMLDRVVATTLPVESVTPEDNRPLDSRGNTSPNTMETALEHIVKITTPRDFDDMIYCGAYCEPADSDDEVFDYIGYAPAGMYTVQVFPESLDLRKPSWRSRDQGARSTCAAMAGANIMSVWMSKNADSQTYISPEFIYYNRENRPHHGMYGRNVFEILKNIGCVPEDMFPYQANEPTEAHKRIYGAASANRITNYSRVLNIDALKRALLEQTACYMLLPMYSKRAQFWRPTENTSATIAENGRSYGHAVAVVGYTREGFILENSWGSDWGDSGSVIFPYGDWPAKLECIVPILSSEMYSRPNLAASKQACTLF